jgi:CBS domain-containing protein
MYGRYFSDLAVSLEAVTRVLTGDPLEWLPGSQRRPDGAVEILADVGPVGRVALRKKVRIALGPLAKEDDQVRLPLAWRASGPGFLFPEMDGELEASRWDGTHTLLCLQVDYTPPLGAVGRQLDDRLLHRLAWLTLGTFRDGITESLQKLAGEPAPPQAAGGDLAAVLAASPAVAEIMTTDVITLLEDQTIQDAARALKEHRISGAPVVQGLEVVGFLSESDIVRALAPTHDPRKAGSLVDAIGGLRQGVERAAADRKVRAVMTRKVVTVRAEDGAWEAAELLQRRGFKALPVTGALGRLEGIVARSDLLRLVAPPDDELTRRVRRALVALDAAASQRVTATVVGGTVTLSGVSRSWRFKQDAVQLVRQIPGVRQVEDQLSYLVPKPGLDVGTTTPEDGAGSRS